jgi:hypothetical protein
MGPGRCSGHRCSDRRLRLVIKSVSEKRSHITYGKLHLRLRCLSARLRSRRFPIS